jgi:hypothetical protein
MYGANDTVSWPPLTTLFPEVTMRSLCIPIPLGPYLLEMILRQRTPRELISLHWTSYGRTRQDFTRPHKHIHKYSITNKAETTSTNQLDL